MKSKEPVIKPKIPLFWEFIAVFYRFFFSFRELRSYFVLIGPNYWVMFYDILYTCHGYYRTLVTVIYCNSTLFFFAGSASALQRAVSGGGGVPQQGPQVQPGAAAVL